MSWEGSRSKGRSPNVGAPLLEGLLLAARRLRLTPRSWSPAVRKTTHICGAGQRQIQEEKINGTISFRHFGKKSTTCLLRGRDRPALGHVKVSDAFLESFQHEWTDMAEATREGIKNITYSMALPKNLDL